MVQSYSPGCANVHLHLLHASLGQPKSTSQMASRSIQPFLQSLRSWQTNWQAGWFFTARLRPQFQMPPVRNIPPSIVLLQQCHCLNCHRGQTSKSISFVSFVRIESNFFYNTQETQMQKMMDQSNSVIFDNFLKFSKRHRTVPLQPIWTIMVAAKLDQSRVLVTEFRQNLLTMNGRSAGQRHTDRQTNSAENNGPSALHSGQQIDHVTQSVTVGCICVHSTAMQPKKAEYMLTVVSAFFHQSLQLLFITFFRES